MPGMRRKHAAAGHSDHGLSSTTAAHWTFEQRKILLSWSLNFDRVRPGRSGDCASGAAATLDLAMEVPDDELSSVATNAIWDSIYSRLAELALEHRSTLVFVNTRRMVERLAFALERAHR